MKILAAVLLCCSILVTSISASAQEIMWRCGIDEVDQDNYNGVSKHYYLILKGPNNEAKIRPHCVKFESWLKKKYPPTPHRNPFWVSDEITTLWHAPASATPKDGVEIQKKQYDYLRGDYYYFTYKKDGSFAED